MPVLALGAVDLVALLVALAAVLVLAAMWVFAKPIEAVLGRVPYVGRYLNGSFSAFLEWAIQGVIQVYDSLTHAVGHWLYGLAAGLWHLVYQQVQTLTFLGQQIVATAERMGVLFTQAMNQALLSFWQAAGFAQGLFNTAEADIASAAATALADTEWFAGVLHDQITAAAATALADTEWFAAVLHNEIGAAAATLEGDIATVQSDVISVANTLFGEAEAAIAGVEAEVTSVAAGLEGQIQGVEGQLGPLLGILPLVGTIPLLNSAVQALTAEADTCLKPLCDTVTPSAKQLGSLGKFLQGLEALGIAGLATLLFEEAVNDPKGLAHDTVSVVEAVGDPIVSGVRTLIGK